MVDRAARQEWIDGWPLVLASIGGVSVSSVVVYSMGVLMLPLQQEFNWSRSEITSGLMINSVVAVICAPFVGRLIDRLGPRRICLPGLAIFCSAYAALALADGSKWQWWALWFLISIGALMLKPTVFSTAVASRFDRSRGAALALTLCGTGLTGIVAPVLSALILKHYDWRMAYLGTAAIWFLVVFPICALHFYGSVDVQRRSIRSKASAVPGALTGVDAREGLLSRTYLRLALSAFLTMLVISSMIIHLVPFLNDAGLRSETAASIASVTGGAVIVGRLLTGVLLDRFSGSVVGAAIFALPAVVMVGLLNYNGSVAMAMVLAVLVGFSSGAELDIAAYMTSRHFGMKNYGLLFGIIVGLLSLALGVGPALMSAVFDRFGSYEYALLGAIVLSLSGSLLVASLGPYDPRFVARAAV